MTPLEATNAILNHAIANWNAADAVLTFDGFNELDSFIAAAILNRLRAQGWWRAPLVSTLVGASLDTAIFFTIAFSASLVALEPGNDVSWAGELLPLLGIGPEAPLWVSLATADWLVKLSLALVALVPFRMIVGKLSARVA